MKDTWCFISIWSARTQGVVCMTKISTKSQSIKKPPEVIQSNLLPLGRTACRTFFKIFRKGGSTDFMDSKIHSTTTFPSASSKPLISCSFPFLPKGYWNPLWSTTGGGGVLFIGWSHYSMGNRWGNSDRLYFGGLQNHCRWTAAMKLKDACSLEEKLWPT